jgi:hypothetical protein
VKNWAKDTDMQEREQNAKKAQEAARALFPLEKWDAFGGAIFIAKSRLPKSAEELSVLEKEIAQATILADRGSTIYLLPETVAPGEMNIKHPDAVVDGYIMEFKTIIGSIRQIGERYKDARAKADHIFLKIDSPLVRHEVQHKLSGYIRQKNYRGGIILAYFTETAELYQWSEEELVKKNPPLARRRLSEKNGETAVQPFTPR